MTNNDLKWFIVLALFTSSGNRFHRTGPATLKYLSPYDLSLETERELAYTHTHTHTHTHMCKLYIYQ